ncbi:Secretion system C-terminal sorting domain-containing protein [Flavobacterium longum]|uniref:T9SS type A sorting domain-containing protein n=1 Tax=Flavobacterium longum TaxID=1299340 RepID=UPI0039EC0C6C
MISGTPTAATATATYTVTATNSGGSTTFGIVITVNDVAPSSLAYDTPNIYTVGFDIDALVPVVSGNVDSYTASPSLPDGLTIDPVTGIISGIPSAVTPTAIYTVTASNSGGNISFDISITVNDVAPNSLTYTSPNIFTVGNAITNLNPTVTGTVVSYSVSPSLPSGLTLNTSTGVISGTPTAVTATATYTVAATNSGGIVSFDITITVNPAAPVDLAYPTPNIFTVGQTIGSLSPTVIGENLTFSIVPELPIGLVFSPASGMISGMPGVISPATTYTVTANNESGSVSFDLSIAVVDAAPTALNYTTPANFTTGQMIIPLVPTVVGNVTDFSVFPELPAGLAIDPVTGVISGTPTSATATATYTVTATNSGGSVTFDIEITVSDPLGTIDPVRFDFMVWPNPFADVINISGLSGEIEYVLLSIDGRRLEAGKTANGKLYFDRLPEGVYLLQITQYGQTETKKIIKKN